MFSAIFINIFYGVYKKLNKLYKTLPALHRGDVLKDGFEWIDENDNKANVISFIRKGARN